jgi:hypothetical protein
MTHLVSHLPAGARLLARSGRRSDESGRLILYVIPFLRPSFPAISAFRPKSLKFSMRATNLFSTNPRLSAKTGRFAKVDGGNSSRSAPGN